MPTPATTAAVDSATPPAFLADYRATLERVGCNVPCASDDASCSQQCKAAKAYEVALQESGQRLVIPSNAPWLPIEGTSAADILRQHPDPLGALQRAEVPYVMLRGAVPPPALNEMAARMMSYARGAAWPVTSGERPSPIYSVMRTYPARKPWCALVAIGKCPCLWRYEPPDGSNRTRDIARAQRRCLARSPRACLDAELEAAFANGSEAVLNCEKGVTAARGPYHEYGRKLLNGFDATKKRKFMSDNRIILNSMNEMNRSCRGPFCTPMDAMLHGVQQIAGSRRKVVRAQEGAEEPYVPGIVRVMRNSFYYPLHYDSHHANAWAELRPRICGAHEKVTSKLVNVGWYPLLSRHTFSASVILTLQAADRHTKKVKNTTSRREGNPFDLTMYRTRWPELLHNCSVRATTYGVGGKLNGRTVPAAVTHNPIEVRGEAGDLYLFNSEFLHLTPKIAGDTERIVAGGVAGYSEGKATVELWS